MLATRRFLRYTAAVLATLIGVTSGCSCEPGTLSSITDFVPTPPSVAPTSLSFSAATSQVQTVTMTDAVHPPYTLSGCNGIVTASDSGSTITVDAVSGGTCTLSITDSLHRSAAVAISVTTASIPIQ